MTVTKIIGPPGTGKTTSLLDILSKELEAIDPNRIAYVSYTRKGAYEGKKRAKEKFGFTDDDCPYFLTLHAIAYRLGGYSKTQILGPEQYEYFGDKLGLRFDGISPDERYLHHYELFRNCEVVASKHFDGLDVKVLDYVIHNLKRFKDQYGLVDFTDIIDEFIARNTPLPVDVAIIDEAQDLTTLQWKMVEVAFRNVKRLYIAGDDDQALYEYKGADVRRFIRMKADHVNVLDTSWRLPDTVLEYAKAIVDSITERTYKDYHGTGKQGSIHRMKEIKELPIDSGNWYLLARTRYQLHRYTEYLRENGYVYSTHRKKFTSHYGKDTTESIPKSRIQAINDYESIRKGRLTLADATPELVQLIGTGFKRWNAPWFEAISGIERSEIDYIRSVLARDPRQDASRIHVSTIHAVKGGEADNVALLLDVTRKVAKNMRVDWNEEMRCYYVGATRAKQNLYLIDPKTSNHYPIMR